MPDNKNNNIDFFESTLLYIKNTQVEMHNTQNTISTQIIATTNTQNNYNRDIL